jgi:hypothetical protein
MDFGVEICACGHPVHKHVLADTEYARCNGSNTLCRCSGGVRIVGRAFGSVSKYFRREMVVSGEYRTLNRAIEKCVESRDGDYVWLVEDCDSCAFPIENDAHAYSSLQDGELLVEVVCGICHFERGG